MKGSVPSFKLRCTVKVVCGEEAGGECTLRDRPIESDLAILPSRAEMHMHRCNGSWELKSRSPAMAAVTG